MLDNIDLLHDAASDSIPRAPSSRDSVDEVSGAFSRLSMTASSNSKSRSEASSEDCQIYYRRQMLTSSLEGRRVDLITITDCHGVSGQLEDLPAGIVPAVQGEAGIGSQEPAALFTGKKVAPTQPRVAQCSLSLSRRANPSLNPLPAKQTASGVFRLLPGPSRRDARHPHVQRPSGIAAPAERPASGGAQACLCLQARAAGEPRRCLPWLLPHRYTGSELE